MSHFSRTILSAAVIAIVTGCSSADPSTPLSVGPQTRSVLASVAPAVGSVSDARVGNLGAAQLALGDANVKATLRALASHAASRSGVSAPEKMHAVGVADHQTAATVIGGAVIKDHAPVYVIKMTGGPFTASQHPPGVAAPQGNVLVLTVDAATYRVTDIG